MAPARSLPRPALELPVCSGSAAELGPETELEHLRLGAKLVRLHAQAARLGVELGELAALELPEGRIDAAGTLHAPHCGLILRPDLELTRSAARTYDDLCSECSLDDPAGVVLDEATLSPAGMSLLDSHATLSRAGSELYLERVSLERFLEDNPDPNQLSIAHARELRAHLGYYHVSSTRPPLFLGSDPAVLAGVRALGAQLHELELRALDHLGAAWPARRLLALLDLLADPARTDSALTEPAYDLLARAPSDLDGLAASAPVSSSSWVVCALALAPTGHAQTFWELLAHTGPLPDVALWPSARVLPLAIELDRLSLLAAALSNLGVAAVVLLPDGSTRALELCVGPGAAGLAQGLSELPAAAARLARAAAMLTELISQRSVASGSRAECDLVSVALAATC